MICVISCLADHPPKDLPSAPRRAPSAGRRELPRSLDRRRSRWWSRNADAAPPETASTAFPARHARCSRPPGTGSASHPGSACRPFSPPHGSWIRRRGRRPCRRRSTATCQRAREATLMETCGSPVFSHAGRANRNCAPRAKRWRRAAPAGWQRGIARGRRPVNGLRCIKLEHRSAVASSRKRRTLGDSWPDSWPNALRGVLSYRGRRWRTELAAVEHCVIALLAFLETYRCGEHVSPTLRLFELVHPPIRDLTELTGILRAGSVGSVDERNALHLVAIVFRIRPGDADGECRPLVIQGKSLRQVLRVPAIREGGLVFRPGGADHDRRAIAPVDGAGQGAPMGPAAGLDRNRRPSRRSLKGYALATDAVVGGAGILRARRRRDGEGEQSRRQKISQRVHGQFCNRDSRTHILSSCRPLALRRADVHYHIECAKDRAPLAAETTR